MNGNLSDEDIESMKRVLFFVNYNGKTILREVSSAVTGYM